MAIHSSNKYRTEVENVLLREMVEEDREFVNAGDMDDYALDDMVPDEVESHSLFDDDAELGDEDVDAILGNDDDLLFEEI